VDVYSDEWIDVVMPAIEAGYETETVQMGGTYALDLLSAATPVIVPDLVSSATSFKERRHQGDVSLDVSPESTWGIGGTLGVSHTPDYLTEVGAVRYRQDLFDRMSTLSASYSLALERMGMSTDPSFLQRNVGHGLDLSWKQILTKTTTATLLLSGTTLQCGEAVGCLASPYRYVPVEGQGGAVAIGEKNPDALHSAAVGLRGATALSRHFAVHGGYRLYADTWKVIGHTGDLAGTLSVLQEQLLLRLRSRIASQSSASFYRDVYATDGTTFPHFRTQDRELSGLNATSVGGRAEWAFFGAGPFVRLSFSGRVDRTWYRYPDFERMPVRNALVTGGGIDAEF
jgi:hypothetical protein